MDWIKVDIFLLNCPEVESGISKNEEEREEQENDGNYTFLEGEGVFICAI